MKNNQGFDYGDFLCQKLKKVDLNFLEILVDFIKTDEKIKTRFLESIDENENYFPKNIHYKIIYILSKLDFIKLKNYKKNINIDEEIYEYYSSF